MAHDSQLEGVLHALVGPELNMGVADKLRQKY